MFVLERSRGKSHLSHSPAVRLGASGFDLLERVSSSVKQGEGSTVQQLRAQTWEPGSLALNSRSAVPVVCLTFPGCKPGMTTVCGTQAFVRMK